MYLSSTNFDHGHNCVSRGGILVGILLGGFRGHNVEAESLEETIVLVDFGQPARFRQIEFKLLFHFRILHEIVLPYR